MFPRRCEGVGGNLKSSKPELWGLQFTTGLPCKIPEQIKWSCNILHDHKRATRLDIHVRFKVDLSKLSWFSCFQKSFPLNCEACFWFPSQFWKSTQLLRKPWYVTISFIAPKYYPSVSLCRTSFCKSWRNTWPCSTLWNRRRVEYMSHSSEFSLSDTGVATENRKSLQDNQFLHPFPNQTVTNHAVPCKYQIFL